MKINQTEKERRSAKAVVINEDSYLKFKISWKTLRELKAGEALKLNWDLLIYLCTDYYVTLGVC